MKRILITGANSYIGTSFEKWLERWPDEYIVDTIDMVDEKWKNRSFKGYDVVFHVAGIAHVSANPKMKDLYFKINRDLTIETAKKAKEEGIKQFIFMSSIIVYGDSSHINHKRVIDKKTIPEPSNFYGRSKLEAEKGITPLQDDRFNVVIIRPPMIFGKGSKGNYPKLAKVAQMLPVFPDIKNERSMLHIDNLCEFIKLMIDHKESGMFFPQNGEYVSTSEMVKQIAAVHGKNIIITKLLNPLLLLSGNFIGIVNKVFGNLVYDKGMSEYKANYRIRNFEQSVWETEIDQSRRPKVLILVNHDVVIYNFRKELVERLLKENYEVYISSPYGERIDDLVSMGCKHIEANIERRGTNILEELYLLYYYKKIIKEMKPNVVLSYTIKPNIYGGLVCRILKVPYIANITGLGSAVENKHIMQNITTALYRLAFKGVSCLFLQNEENLRFFADRDIANDKHRLIPGSGVNLDQYNILDYPSGETIEFVFISRIMKEKGIEQYIEAANYITSKYPNTRFHICGFCEEMYEDRLIELQKVGVITYHGMQRDVRTILKNTHCTIHPTYYPEGMSNVLLESAACGRPIITTNRSGCREIVDNGVNGFIAEMQNSEDLIHKIEKFLKLSYEAKKQMGLAGRKKVEEEFNRQIVVDAYMEEIEKCKSNQAESKGDFKRVIWRKYNDQCNL